jgi:hypothetical protein
MITKISPFATERFTLINGAFTSSAVIASEKE